MTFVRYKALIDLICLSLVCVAAVEAQTPNADPQVWPAVNVNVELRDKTRLQLTQGLEAGDTYRKWTTAAMLSYRMKRLLIPSRRENDEENLHVLVIAGGYEYLHASQNGKTKNENRIALSGTGHFTPGGGFLLTDRNRIEFRWVDGVYDFRYRNKVVIDHHLKVGEFSFTPYASGELFHDRNHHSWNENHYAFGSQFPYKKLLMVDTYYLHKNCTTCDPTSVNVVGLTLNLFLKMKKK
jgi:hypothetical protein